MVDDGMSAGVQPWCCGVVMRDRPGAMVCPVCAREHTLPAVATPPEFVGASIHGG